MLSLSTLLRVPKLSPDAGLHNNLTSLVQPARMPLLGSGEYVEPVQVHDSRKGSPPRKQNARRQSQHSAMAKSAIMGQLSTPNSDGARTPEEMEVSKEKEVKPVGPQFAEGSLIPAPRSGPKQNFSNGAALTDTPLTTAPNSPIM